MKQLTIENLRCRDTDDVFGDECRLEVYHDGELHHAYRRDMDDGDDWALDVSLLFVETCSLRLFDEDGEFPGSDDDALGTVHIGPNEVDGATATFAEGGADYTLTYRVVERPDLTPDDLVSSAIDEFERSTEPGVWPQIDKAPLIEQLRERRLDASKIRQRRSQFCGPTSIVYELARTQPRRYVALCRQLYETGGFWSRTNRIDAPASLRASRVGQRMTAADWMLIATMRNEENLLFGTLPDSTGLVSGLEGMTNHWEMEGWTSEILLKDDVVNTTTFLWGELDALHYGHQVWLAGGHAFLLIHTALFDEPGAIVPPWPDHWVVYQGGLDEVGERIRFDVYTWGRIEHVDTTLEHLEDCLDVVVTGL